MVIINLTTGLKLKKAANPELGLTPHKAKRCTHFSLPSVGPTPPRACICKRLLWLRSLVPLSKIQLCTNLNRVIVGVFNKIT